MFNFKAALAVGIAAAIGALVVSALKARVPAIGRFLP